MIFLGSPRTGMGYGSKLVPGAWRVFQLAVKEEGGIGEFFSREAEGRR
jgi:hypothetical protein